MRDPNNKRIFRDLKKDWKRYIVLFLLMSFMIGTASGMFVANGSMMQAIDESFGKYDVEDGRFELTEEATPELLASFPDDIEIYELFAKELTEGGDDTVTVRIYKMREEVDRTCVLQGRLPESDNEIAIDRMHADNQSIKIGDALAVGGREFTVVGLIALSDYSALFKKNSDAMFNAVEFDVAVVTDEAWENLDANIIYTYAYTFRNSIEGDAAIKERTDDLMEEIAVLCATGGYLSDKDSAEQLSSDIDEWTSFLEQIEEESNELQARGEELAARRAEVEAQAELIAAGDPDALLAASELAEDAQRLQDDIDALAAREDEINEVIEDLEALEPYEDDINELKDFVPSYASQAINFAKEDFGSDSAMMGVMVYVFIAVLAFVFAITTDTTIKNEAAIIGTLRATGYTKGEIIRYYMLTPVIITVISAVAGNILGYTIFKDAVVGMYYNSYSLVAYETVWNAKAFIISTVVPLILVSIINLIMIVRLMRLSPLRFLRRDLSTSKRKKAVRLPHWGFLSRFRIRVFLQNIGGYIVLFFGIAFVMLLLSFSVGLPEALDIYKDDMVNNMIAQNQYILKDYQDKDGNVITTSNSSAEVFSLETLVTTDGVRTGEEITVYGVADDSRYISFDTELGENEVMLSASYASKFLLSEGDTITLKEKLSDETYTFTVRGVYDYSGAMAVFMRNDRFNDLFDREPGSFTGYFCNEKITDIDADMIYTVIAREDILALSTQIEHSMGDYMDYVSFACLLIGIMVIYLLTKIIIEKNAGSISMVKVLGYGNGEINSIYVGLTTVMVFIFSVAAAFLGVRLVALLFRVIMYSMTGWFEIRVTYMSYIKIILIMLASYAVVAFFDMRRIKKVPLTDALKNVE
ncbi:MAG: hypothetical protein J5685_10620 [Clostridiales bacterium]|nr:hypothetical protein [Clostridiales bacterium]